MYAVLEMKHSIKDGMQCQAMKVALKCMLCRNEYGIEVKCSAKKTGCSIKDGMQVNKWNAALKCMPHWK
jgi:hypothetical protein